MSTFNLDKRRFDKNRQKNLCDKDSRIYCYHFVKNMDKVKYYYDLGMKQTNLDDLDVLEQRKDCFD